ncbi:MAG: hypothetical protein HRU36_02715 [Rickettsiales bacterium]|nr:hypothetical protein [Rickettsiales bacterium]
MTNLTHKVYQLHQKAIDVAVAFHLDKDAVIKKMFQDGIVFGGKKYTEFDLFTPQGQAIFHLLDGMEEKHFVTECKERTQDDIEISSRVTDDEIAELVVSQLVGYQGIHRNDSRDHNQNEDSESSSWGWGYIMLGASILLGAGLFLTRCVHPMQRRKCMKSVHDGMIKTITMTTSVIGELTKDDDEFAGVASGGGYEENIVLNDDHCFDGYKGDFEYDYETMSKISERGILMYQNAEKALVEPLKLLASLNKQMGASEEAYTHDGIHSVQTIDGDDSGGFVSYYHHNSDNNYMSYYGHSDSFSSGYNSDGFGMEGLGIWGAGY